MRYGRITFRAIFAEVEVPGTPSSALIGEWDDGFTLVVPGIGEALDDVLFMPTVVDAFEERRRGLEEADRAR